MKKEVEKEREDNTIRINVDPGDPIKPYQAKLTKKNRIKFLTEFAKDHNLTRAAHSVGVSRDAITKLAARDKKFKTAMARVKDAYLDAIESACYSVALQPKREGFNDRKLLLQAHRAPTYAPQLNIQQSVKIDARVVNANLQDLFQRYLPTPTEIKETKEIK